MCLALQLPASGQVTLNVTDFAAPGDQWLTAIDTLVESVNIGLPGANQAWILTNLNRDLIQFFDFVQPDTTPFFSEFPSSNLATNSFGIYTYLQVDSQAIYQLGTGGDFLQNGMPFTTHNDPPSQVAAFPMTMGTSWDDSTSFLIQIDGSAFGFDSVRFKNEQVRQITIDGWGQVSTPIGTYTDVLRQRADIVTRDSVWVLFFGMWLPVDASESASTEFTWLSKVTKGPVASVEIDAATFQVLNASYSYIAPSGQLAPIAFFFAEPQPDGSIQFLDASINGPTSWFWDFGDGNTSTDQHPNHTYAQSGTYTVCLTVSNDAASDTYCQEINLLAPPMADFVFTDQGNGTFSFTDLSTNDPTSWLWDFGDGNTSTEQNPTHTYAEPGTYTVCLTVANDAGEDIFCQTLMVVFPPEAAFSFTIDMATVTFTDMSSNDPTSWMWDFGDGNTSTEQNPTHTYTASGDYEVCLTAANSAGEDTFCDSVSVIISSLTEAFAHLQLEVFPNPTAGQLHVRLLGNAQPMQLLVHDALGRELQRHTLTRDLTLDASHLQPGTYFYRIQTPDGQPVGFGRFLVVR